MTITSIYLNHREHHHNHHHHHHYHHQKANCSSRYMRENCLLSLKKKLKTYLRHCMHIYILIHHLL
jgi:hypothetical protein